MMVTWKEEEKSGLELMRGESLCPWLRGAEMPGGRGVLCSHPSR